MGRSGFEPLTSAKTLPDVCIPTFLGVSFSFIRTGFPRAIIHGTVAGRIYNKGGRVELFGMAAAVENLSPDAATIIDGAAHVLRGRRLETVR